MIIQDLPSTTNSIKKKFVAAFIAAMLCLPLVLAGCSGTESKPSGDNPKDGQAPYKSEQEVQEELDRKVEEGMLDISIAAKITFDNAKSEGIANIENVPGNRYDVKVRIEDQNNGELLYETPMMKPNQFIEKIKLYKELPAGTYPAIATFIAYDQTSGAEVGQAAAQITIEVLK